MNGVVKHIIIYAAGLLSGVGLTLLIVKVMQEPGKKPAERLVYETPKEIVKRDTVEKVVYKKPKSIEKEEPAQIEDTLVEMQSDTLIYMNDSIQELNINREVLIAVKNFTIQNLAVDTTQTNALRDSLERSMGIKTERNTSTIRVEFWKSPLNFEGYILGKNVVRLYGVSELEPLIFYKLDRKLYMKKATGLYALIRSEEYHKFELSKGEINDKILQISRNG